MKFPFFFLQVHISNSSEVADHSLVYALSDDSDAHVKQPCDHDHTDPCDRCEGLRDTLTEIERVVNEADSSITQLDYIACVFSRYRLL